VAKIVFGMTQSLDGYVAGVQGELEPPLHGPPGAAFFRYWIEYVRNLAGSLYGRRMYEVMRYWDEDQPEWDAAEHEFAAVWRAHPKWVASRSLKVAGANATLVGDDLEGFVRRLKVDVEGTIAVAGPDLAASLPTLLSSMSTSSTFVPSCLAAASRTLPVPGRRCVSSPPIPLAKTRSD